MNIPQLTGIVDLVSLQSAIGLILLSDERLKDVPMLPEVKLLAESEQQVDVLWTLPRQAVRFLPTRMDVDAVVSDGDGAQKVGCGLLVEMPSAASHSPAVTGPPLTWEVSIVAFEDRNTNFVNNVGIGIMAEQLAQLVLDILQLQQIAGYGTFQASSGKAIDVAHDWIALKPGIFAYRATVAATIGRNQTPRSADAKATFVGGNCTITCTDPNAEIRYTTDGSMPVKANPNATVYVNAFPVQSGDMILTGTFTPNKINSSVLRFFAP